jgi:hypothetical protein
VSGEKAGSAQSSGADGRNEAHPSKQIERMPAIGGEADLAQYLQVVPGVIFTGDQGGQLYIRGGSPIMNKVHARRHGACTTPSTASGCSACSTTTSSVTRTSTTAGFNAEHGGRVSSSMMDITTRDGNKTRSER